MRHLLKSEYILKGKLHRRINGPDYAVMDTTCMEKGSFVHTEIVDPSDGAILEPKSSEPKRDGRVELHVGLFHEGEQKIIRENDFEEGSRRRSADNS